MWSASLSDIIIKNVFVLLKQALILIFFNELFRSSNIISNLLNLIQVSICRLSIGSILAQKKKLKINEYQGEHFNFYSLT